MSLLVRYAFVSDNITLEQMTGQQYLFACKKCGRAYKRKSSLYNHCRWECGKEPQFKCDYCPYKGRQKIHFIMHVMAKHKEHKQEVLNSAYNKNLISAPYVNGHKLKKLPGKATKERKNCRGCSKRKTLGIIPKSKIKKVTTYCDTCPGWPKLSVIKLYVCAVCGRKYKQKCTLRRHQTYECNKEPQFEYPLSCQNCGRSYKQKANLRRHLRVECGVGPKIKCPLCNLTVKYVYVLKRHLKRDYLVELTPALCTRRKKWRILKTALLQSEQNIIQGHQVGSGFVCGTCGRTYKLKSSLRNHKKWECGKEPQFSCPFCQYKAKQKMHINRHIDRMHIKEISGSFDDIENGDLGSVREDSSFEDKDNNRKFNNYTECLKCHKKYKYKKNCVQHIRLQCSKEPRFACGICNQTYKFKKDLIRHVTEVHVWNLPKQ
ncbi:unnamed protein product [Phyllotreta striolata]|uniref:C2H2-type domain-containing protein n=1 Tax=Phyllotreta striolata TaxID=444603 RepID=A0A9N9U107_PHYSR|nr:unnamed protein product [Phyllotreta striolata]